MFASDLVEAVEGSVQTGVVWWLVGDLDGVLQDASGDDVLVRAGRWLPADEHPVVMVSTPVLSRRASRVGNQCVNRCTF